MTTPAAFPRLIAALHLPPFPGSGHPDAQPIDRIRDFALRNSEAAVKAGVPALYLQDLGDHPVARGIPPHITAGVAVIGAAVRQAFPQLHLGICLLGHSAREPLAIAQAIGAQSVRLKVYVGAMVKADGVLEGLAYEAIHYRREIGAEDIAILADVYDRTGEPLGRMPLEEEARQAALFGRADALVLTGHSFAETQEMVAQVRRAKLEKPLFIGGGVDAKNVRQALASADGVIVSSAFKPIPGWSRQSLLSDWDSAKMVDIMRQVNGR